jgi:ubiquinone/menaquinone biosynthesis C-methylase UbiE
MLSKILPYMRCPNCSGGKLQAGTEILECKACHTRYPIRNGIVDMAGDDPNEVITPFQRIMQTPLVVYIYEKLWRRIGYYLASSRAFSKEMETVLQLGKDQNTTLVLDLACGTGVFTRPLAEQSGELVVGLDLSWPMLKQARRLMQREGIQNILLVRATAFSLPFADGAVPYVNCCGALHLFDRPGDALKEIRRILSPGGCLCVQTTIRPGRSAGFAYFLERFIRFGFFNELQLREQIKGHGFTVVRSERHRISFTFLARNPQH